MFKWFISRVNPSDEDLRAIRIAAHDRAVRDHKAIMARIDVKKTSEALKAEFCQGEYARCWIREIAGTSYTLCTETDAQTRAVYVGAQERFQAVLKGQGYPKKLRQALRLDFMSQETIDRDYDGSWFYWFK